jgi:micrococcal nuclease
MSESPRIQPTQADIDLLSQHTTTTPKFTLENKCVVGKCVNVYDGDTVHVVFRIPNLNDQAYKWVIRLTGIDTPEMKSKNPVEKAAAVRARDYLRGEILDKIVVVECGEFDKYGRLLGNIYINDVCLNTRMIELGHAKVYDGGTKAGWADV